VEFKDKDGRPNGKKIYLQLKSAIPIFGRRRSDGLEVFTLRTTATWNIGSVSLLTSISSSADRRANQRRNIRWIDVTRYLKNRKDKKSRQIIFEANP